MDREVSIGEYLTRQGYSKSFTDNYLIPMTAAIWSTPPDKCALDFPARTLIQFLHNHHLLQLTGKPDWLTLRGGSKAYVNTVVSSLPSSQLHLSTPIKSITSHTVRATSQVTITTTSGVQEVFDHVILACHSDTSLEILRQGGGVTPDEERILGKFKWNKNEVVLHSDPALMPKSRLAWSCWNYLTTSTFDESGTKKANIDRVSLTYGMNDLQHIPESKFGPVLVTLNPPFEPSPDRHAGSWRYDHPILDTDAIRAQAEIPTIQATRGISYAGAWLRYGFHEDGFTSGLNAALNIDKLTSSAASCETRKESIRPPFPVIYAESVPSPQVLLGFMFDLLERTGFRVVIGFVGGIWLMMFRWMFELLGVDLSHLDV